MSDLKIGFRDNQTTYQPGETLHGAAGWQLEQPPTSAEVRLFYYTHGKGTEDVTLVDTVRFDQPKPADARPFEFTLPAGPYSFSGKLITLTWAVELVIEPGSHAARAEFTMSPTGREILLSAIQPVATGR